VPKEADLAIKCFDIIVEINPNNAGNWYDGARTKIEDGLRDVKRAKELL